MYGTVIGRFLSSLESNLGDPLVGQVTFIPEASAILIETGDPETVLPAPIVTTLDQDGRLSVDLLAPGPGTNPPMWTYRVIPQLWNDGVYVHYAPWSIEVPAGEVTDLTLVAAVPTVTGEYVTRGLPGKDGIGVPAGGAAGQHLVKVSAEDNDTTWETPAAGGAGVSDHGALTGLDDDDHPQYALTDGSRGAFSPVAHSHAVEDVTGLQTVLDGKSEDGHTHTWGAVTGKPVVFPPDDHVHVITSVTGLGDALDGKAAATHSHPWSEVTGKPATYPPEAHAHAWDTITAKPTSYPPVAHGHAQGDVTGLTDALAGKASTSHTHPTSDVTGLDSALSGKAPTTHTHAASDITASGTIPAAAMPAATTTVQGAISGANNSRITNAVSTATASRVVIRDAAGRAAFADPTAVGDAATKNYVDTTRAATTHTHATADVTGLDTALSGKAPTSHSHTWNEVTGKPTEFSPSAHTHAVTDVTGLTTALDGKADDSQVLPPGGGTGQILSKIDATDYNAGWIDAPAGGGTDSGITDHGQLTGLADDDHPQYALASGARGAFAPTTHTHAWTAITSKPTTFAPSAHSHAQTDVTGLADALAGKIETLTASASTVTSETPASVTVTGTGATRDLAFAVPAGAPAATTIAFKPGTDLPSTYPTGITIMEVGQTSSGWPASFAVVETVRFGVNRSFQTLVVRTTGKSYRRTPDANDAGWLPWIEWGAKGDPGTTEWTGITGKPTEFPPSAHSHVTADVTGLDTALSGKSDTGHVHTYAQITEKPATYPPDAHTHSYSSLTAIPSTFAPSAHTHLPTEISGAGTIPNAAVPLATASLTGGINATLFNRLNGATSAATVSRLVVRDAAGRAQFVDPSALADAATKNYVDTQVGTRAATSHTHAQTDVTGLDDALAGKAAATHTHAWESITAKPTEFTPAAHSHLWADISDKPLTFAPTTHGHVTADVTGLDDALAGKAPTAHSHAWDDITSKPTTFAPSTHTHAYTDLTGVPTSFTPSAHTHLWDHITDKPSTFAPSAHSHTYASITAKPTTFPPDAHTHDDRYYTEAEVDTALGGKAAATHTHDYTTLTNIPATFAPAAHSHSYASLTSIPTEFTPAVHTHAAATTSVAGFMSTADKTKLDQAVSANTASRLVIRDAAGRAQFVDPSALQDAATKNYVDTGLSSKAATSHTHTTAQVTGLDTALSGKLGDITASASTVSSGTAAAVTVSGTGTTRNLAFQIPAGPAGENGTPGTPGVTPTLSVGTVNQGTTASASFTSAGANAYALNLTIPGPKEWVGTLSQYNAIPTKDPETSYYVTG